MSKLNLKKIGIVIQAIIVFFMLFFIYHEIKNYNIESIKKALILIPTYKIFLGILLVILNYFVLAGYEFLAFNIEKIKLEKKKIIFTSFISYAFANFLGFSGISSIGIRMNLYSLWNLSYKSILKIIKNVYISFLIGILLIGGVSQLIYPNDLKKFDFILNNTFSIGIIFIILGLFFIFYFIKKRKFKTKEICIQIILGILDWLLISSILYIFLPIPKINFGTFFSIFLCAQILGILSTIPGGFGVFDIIFIKLLNSYYSNDVIIAILIIYRGLYYLAPFIISFIAFVFYRLFLMKDFFKEFGSFISNIMVNLSIEILSILVFLSGALLLFSGAIPQNILHIEILSKILPTNIIILSHLLASITGTLLLILAYGIKRRLDIAYFLTIILILLGNMFLIFKGFSYSISIILFITFIFLIFERKKFYRKSSILNEEINLKWIVLIGMVIVFSIGIGIFSFENIEYSNELWWQFTLDNEAPMFMRASLVSVLIFICFLILRMFHPIIQIDKIKSSDVQEEIKEIVKFSKFSNSNLAFLDDKYIYFNEEKTNFIMYGKNHNRIISMGDPVGNEENLKDIIWDFYNITKRSGYNIVFYEINKENLNYYLDVGLKIFKIGEEAIVDLRNFTLEGSSQRKLRYIYNKGIKMGITFEIVKFENVKDELKEISDSWLKSKSGSEKEFSLGKFDEEYLSKFEIAVLKYEGKIIAFANIWKTYGKEELSIDLMRYNNEAPTGSMEFLFISLMLWGKQEGYKSFSLGMAPLSGLENRKNSSFWNKFGSFIFKNGGNFYNFIGLKNFKNKFNPKWKPKYIAISGNFNFPLVFNDIGGLVSGGIKGIIKNN